jgi:hypothetical protein
MAFITGFYVLRVAFFILVLAPLKTYTKYGQKYYNKFYKKLFFSEIIMIILEGYVDFAITLFLYIYYDNNVEKDTFQEFVKFVIIFLILVVAPGSMIYVLIHTREDLKEFSIRN